MYSNLFSPESIEELTAALQTQFLSAIWETFYVTLLSTAFAIVIGLPLGVLLVAGERDGVLPLPRWLMSVLNVLKQKREKSDVKKKNEKEKNSKKRKEKS